MYPSTADIEPDAGSSILKCHPGCYAVRRYSGVGFNATLARGDQAWRLTPFSHHFTLHHMKWHSGTIAGLRDRAAWYRWVLSHPPLPLPDHHIGRRLPECLPCRCRICVALLTFHCIADNVQNQQRRAQRNSHSLVCGASGIRHLSRWPAALL